ncbi:MAG: esterase family protein [Chitinophagaceae bacterium]|nr:esterase family protein [Chitinophagaceae bacterium]
MRYWFFLLFVFCTTSVVNAQQNGRVIEQVSVSSAVLGRPVNYTVYLPPDYESSQRTYPVVYLLHGYTDDNTGWLQFGEINRYADMAIADGTIPPMIIIMPDGDSSWYINSYDGKENYEDFFMKEFIPAVERTYRIKTQKRYRGVAGLSMGGYGTLMYALKYPDYFAAAAPLSAAVFSDEELVKMPDGQWERMFGQLYGRGLKGKARLTKAWYDNSALAIVDKKSGTELNKVRYWIDCGDDDFLSIGNSLLHIALRKKLVAHEYRVRDGIHNWKYWRTGITDALAFIGESFR